MIRLTDRLRIADVFHPNYYNENAFFQVWPDVLPTGWEKGGPFFIYQYLMDMGVMPELPFLGDDSEMGLRTAFTLDSDYVYRHSGSKLVGPFLIRAQNDGHTLLCEQYDVYGIPKYVKNVNTFCAAMASYAPKWEILWKNLKTIHSMNVLHTHDLTQYTSGEETTSTQYGKTMTASGKDINTKEQTDDTALTPSGTDTTVITGKVTDKVTPTGSDVSVRTGGQQNDTAGTTAVYGYGFNTPSGTDDAGKKNQRNGSEAHETVVYNDLKDTRTPGVVTTTEHDYNNYKEERTRGQKTDSHYHSSITDDTAYGKVDSASGTDKIVRTPDLTIRTSGYSGRSPAASLAELMDASDVLDFFNKVVYPDMDKLFTLRIY